jgi:hypothetical protein
MKVLSPLRHGIIDYGTVIVFALAPMVLGLDGMAATISYLLAVVHLMMTMLTDMPLGFFKLILMRFHSGVEMLVGPSLLAGALFLPQLFSGGEVFFIVSGIAIFLVWLLSNYHHS